VETNSRICLAAELGLWEIVLGEVDWIGFGQSTETGLCHESRQFDEQAESLFHDRGFHCGDQFENLPGR
jgi:hypothetical protein